jgi:hypothetical protein
MLSDLQLSKRGEEWGYSWKNEGKDFWATLSTKDIDEANRLFDHVKKEFEKAVANKVEK